MGSLGIMALFLCALTLLFDSICSSALEAKPGENITIWNEFNMNAIGFISWYKHTSDSVPLLLGCKQVEISSITKKCYFYNESGRTVMSVRGKNTSLTITAVKISDTGLYYCSFKQLAEMKFCTSVYLQVKEEKDRDEAKDCSCSNVFFMLTVVLGAVNMILFSILIFIILKHRKKQKGANAEVQEDQESESLNYAALQLSNKKTKRKKNPGKSEDPNILYSSVKQ